jgi:hypothetical protein
MMDDMMDLICNLLNAVRQIVRILWMVRLIYSRIIPPAQLMINNIFIKTIIFYLLKVAVIDFGKQQSRTSLPRAGF